MLLIYSLLFFSIIEAQRFEIPEINSFDQIVNHTYITLNYSEKHEQASWVAYTLSANDIYGPSDRTDDFRVDPKVKTGSATLLDYKGSGFDRGHLAPAGDMKRSYGAMSESFFMSNISPQDPSFNRGIWKKLESKVRDWAIDNKKLYVVTGPVLSDNYSTIGNNKVSIPEYFYKVLIDIEEPSLKGIGFILPNRRSKESLSSFAVTIDYVEDVTGINFYHYLEDDIENKIESELNLRQWDFSKSNSKSSYTHSAKIKYPVKGVISVNEASKKELMSLPGIGDKLSNKIIRQRNNYGKFKTLEDLRMIKGIGPKTIEKIRPYVILE